MYQLRLMAQADVPAVASIQAECYSAQLQEDESTILARLLLAPDSAWVAEDEHGVCAYLVSYCSTIGKVTPFNAPFDIAQSADTLYLHDLAISNRCKRRGIGTVLAQAACQKAEEEGLKYSALVSVQDSKPFWLRLGYNIWTGLDPVQLVNLKTYQGPSSYMVRRLGGIR